MKSHLEKLDKHEKLNVLKSHKINLSKLEESESIEQLQEMEAALGMTLDELRDEIRYLNKKVD